MNALKTMLYFFCLFLFILSCRNGYGQEIEKNPSPLTITSAISQALNANRQLLASVEALSSAQYGIDLANAEFQISYTPVGQTGFIGGDRGKPAWTIGGGISTQKKFTSGTSLSITPSITKTGNRYLTEIEMGIEQPLLRGLGKEYQLSGLFGAKFGLRTAYRDLYIAQVQLILRTVQTVYEIIKLEKFLSLDVESVERIEKFYRSTKLKEKIGLSDALDVYRAEIELRQARDTQKGTMERLEDAMDLLRELLGLPLYAFTNDPLRIEAPLLYHPNTLGLQEAIEIALNERIELEQARDEWRESERLSRLAEKNLLPELNLVINYANTGFARAFSQSMTKHRENTWGIGLTSSTGADPLTDQIAYDQSLVAIGGAKRSIEQTEVNIILDVKKIMRQMERAEEKIRVQKEQIRTAEGELYLANIKLGRGMADNLIVIQAEKGLKSAQQAYWSAFIEHIVGEFELLGAIGLLIDKPVSNPYNTQKQCGRGEVNKKLVRQ